MSIEDLQKVSLKIREIETILQKHISKHPKSWVKMERCRLTTLRKFQVQWDDYLGKYYYNEYGLHKGLFRNLGTPITSL